MPEGRLYKADIEHTASGVVLRLRDRPNVIGTGPSFDEAYEDLVGAIILATGDGEPRITLRGIFPPARVERPWISHQWVSTVARGECILHWNTPELFTDGVCGLCGRPRGVRNSTPLNASPGSSGDFCGSWFLWGEGCTTHWMKNRYTPVIVSERFHAAMTPCEREGFEWKPVTMPARSRTRYLECVPREFVAVSVHKAWAQAWLRCDECGGGEPRCSPSGKPDGVDGSGIVHWLAEGALRRPPVPFAAGTPGDYSLIWPTGGALELVKGSHARGMSLFHAGAIPDVDIDPAPVASSLAQLWGWRRADRAGSDGNPV